MKKDLEIYKEVINVGIAKSKKKTLVTAAASIFGGGYIALGSLGYLTAIHYLPDTGTGKLIGSFLFPVGLLLILLTGAELFTGNNLLTVALFHRKITLKDVSLNWLKVWVFNALGAALIALLVANSGLIHDEFTELVHHVVEGKLSLTFSQAFVRGILCNILVAMAVWVSYGADDIAGKVLVIWMPITVFVFSGFEHSVANMFYFSLGLMEGMNISLSHILISNLIPVTLGNIVGGGLVLPILYYTMFKDKV